MVLHTFTPVALCSSNYIRLPTLFCGVRITYVYTRCFVEFVLHMFFPLVLWSSYCIRLTPLFWHKIVNNDNDSL